MGVDGQHHYYLNMVQFVGAAIDNSEQRVLRVVAVDGAVTDVSDSVWVNEQELRDQAAAINTALRDADVDENVRAVVRAERLQIITGLGEEGDDDGS